MSEWINCRGNCVQVVLSLFWFDFVDLFMTQSAQKYDSLLSFRACGPSSCSATSIVFFAFACPKRQCHFKYEFWTNKSAMVAISGDGLIVVQFSL